MSSIRLLLLFCFIVGRTHTVISNKQPQSFLLCLLMLIVAAQLLVSRKSRSAFCSEIAIVGVVISMPIVVVIALVIGVL